MEGSDGNFYGSTLRGGGHDGGTFFKCTPAGGLTPLLSFPNVSGEGIEDALIEGTDGAFYGTTRAGGSNFLGGIVRVTTNGAMTTIASFNQTNGSRPLGWLTSDAEGNFYGTANEGSSNGYGCVFKVTSTGEIATLHSFNATDGSPEPGLTRREDGAFVGATIGPYPSFSGILFSITQAGMLTNLAQFTGVTIPVCRFAEDAAGNLFGTTIALYGYGMGTVFKLAPDGVLNTLLTFSETNGAYPYAGLVRAHNGDLYGATEQGGAYGYGTVFRLSPPLFLNFQQSGSTLILSWPTNSTGSMLQAATNMTGQAPWLDVTNVPSVVSSNFVVTNSILPPNRFYRLRK